MKMMAGSLVALMLLGIYVYAVFFGIVVVNCMGTPGCDRHTEADFTAGMAQALTLVGGLVSALVIAELAVTQPGQAPMAHTLSEKTSPSLQRGVKGLAMAYLVVWLLAGVAAYVIGTLHHPNLLQPLSDVGQAWLGLAVAASYAYFGIRPPARG